MMRDGNERDASALDVALAAPALAWLAGAVIMLGAMLGGYRALEAPADLTIAEAAAVRDEAEVLRRIREGIDPAAPARIRRGLIRDDEYLITPLEAAVASGHIEVVELLVRHGAPLDAARASALLCLARAAEADDIVSFLGARVPAGTNVQCGEVRLPW